MTQATGWSDTVVKAADASNTDPFADLEPAKTKAQLVFVPGHWHTLFFTKPIVAAVEQLNHQIVPHQLASVGRKEPRPTFADDVSGINQAVLQVLETGQDAVLVLHSYAGMPGSEAVNQLIELGALNSHPGRGRLRRVVYIAAYFFPAGFQMDAKIFIGDDDPMFSIDDKTGLTHFADPYIGFFNDMSREAAQPFLEQIGDTYYLGPDPCLTSEKWRTAPVFYIQALRDQAMPIERQIGISQGIPSMSLDTGHDPYVSQPAAVAEILGKFASSE